MSATWAALLGALIGGVTAIISAALTSVVTYWNELGNRDEARQSANIAALRQQISLAFTELFAIQHALNWITWFAEHDEASVDAEMVHAYDAEVHAARPRLLAALAMVAALDLAVYEQLEPLVSQLSEIELEVAAASRGLPGRRQATIARLQESLPRLEAIEKSFPLELARIMKLAEQRQRPRRRWLSSIR